MRPFGYGHCVTSLPTGVGTVVTEVRCEQIRGLLPGIDAKAG